MPVDDALVREAWEELLEVSVNEDTDFFESGGHSLLAVALSIAVDERLGVEPPPDLVYRHRTFGAYAVALNSSVI